MVNIGLIITVLLVFALVSLWVGAQAQKNQKSTEDYFLAGRSLGLGSLVGTLLATQLGGGVILGTAQHAYYSGFSGLYYSLGMAGGFLLLGFGFAAKLRDSGVKTIVEIFEVYYHSPKLRKIASLFSILVLTGILIGQVIASKNLLHGFGVESSLFFYFFWALIIFYTMYGGLEAVVMTDILQTGIIFSVFGVLFLYVLLTNNIPVSLSDFFSSYNPVNSITHSNSGGSWTGYILMPILFSLVEQDLAQRFFAAKNKSHAMTAALISAVSLLTFAVIPAFFGVYARYLSPNLNPDQNALIAVLKIVCNDIGFALVVCGLVAAIVSTADSLLCAISSNVVQDFFPQDKLQTKLSRGATGVIGVTALLGARYAHDILSVLTQSYELFIITLFIPIISAFLSRDKTNTGSSRYKFAAYGAIISGIFGYFLFRADLFSPFYINYRELWELLFSGFGYIGGYILGWLVDSSSSERYNRSTK